MPKGDYRMLAAIAALSIFGLVDSASALTMKECSEKYKAASAAGSIGAATWNDFRKDQCGANATMALTPAKQTKAEKAAERAAKKAAEKAAKAELPKADTATPETKEAAATVSSHECSERYQAAKTDGTLGGMTWNEFRKAGCPAGVAATTGMMVPTAGAMFPAGIAKKYAGQSAGKARRMTCLDQYRANKAAGINQPRWIKAGGGYYSECNKRLKQ